MMKIALLTIGCIGIAAIAGCSADPQAADADQTPGSEAENTARLEVVPNAIGQFHLIRIANTQLCVQPQGGSTADVRVELTPCVSSAPAQNWLFKQEPTGDFEIINAQSGKCLYDFQDAPLHNGAPITHQSCDVSTAPGTPSSNALWKPSSLRGLATLESRVTHRDSGFCLDVPGGNPFNGAALQAFQCNGTPAQEWIVGVE